MARIALAEDDSTMVQLLSTLLSLDGFEVEDVGDGDVAAAVQSSLPDVLILDMHLQNQNGLDVVDAIRRSERGHDMPIIMISGLNVGEDCLRRGANDFLLKPFMPEELLRLVRKNLPSPQ